MREHDIPRLIFTVVIDQLYIPPFDSSSTWQRLVGESSKKKEKSGTGKVNHTAKYFSRKAANRERTTKRVVGVGARKANARKNSRLVDNNDGSLLREYSCNRPPRLMTATPFPLSLRLRVFALSLSLSLVRSLLRKSTSSWSTIETLNVPKRRYSRFIYHSSIFSRYPLVVFEIVLSFSFFFILSVRFNDRIHWYLKRLESTVHIAHIDIVL